MNEHVDDDLIERLGELKRVAWLPLTEEGDGAATSSKFSGTPWLGPGKSWPVCPRCRKPMALFLQLNLGTLPEELGDELGVGLLQMFYCVSRRECATQGEGCREPFSPYQFLRRVDPAEESPAAVPPAFDHAIPARRIIGWEPVEDYPDVTELESLGIAIDDDARDTLVDLGYSPRQNDKLLGWPSWPQFVDYPACRVCGRDLWIIFQLESGQNLKYMFGDDGCGHVTGCHNYPGELAFLWSSY